MISLLGVKNSTAQLKWLYGFHNAQRQNVVVTGCLFTDLQHEGVIPLYVALFFSKELKESLTEAQNKVVGQCS